MNKSGNPTVLNRWLGKITFERVNGLARYGWLKIRNENFQGQRFLAEAGLELHVGPQAKIEIGQGLSLKRNFIGTFNGQVKFGNNVTFMHNCTVSVHQALTVGDDCLFGELVSIHDENHVIGDKTRPIRATGFETKPITIGKNVWVGAKATILQGVSIGDNAVIGAHSVVTKDVPANSIAVGIPARVIRQI